MEGGRHIGGRWVIDDDRDRDVGVTWLVCSVKAECRDCRAGVCVFASPGNVMNQIILVIIQETWR